MAYAMQSGEVCLDVHKTGATAAERLRTAARLTVMAVFSRSMYVREGEKDIVCLVREDLPPGPLNAVCSHWPAGGLPPAGTWLERTGEDRFRGGGITLAMDRACRWEPEPWPAATPASLRNGIAALLRLPRDRIPEDSPARLLFSRMGEAGPPPPSAMDRLIFDAIEPGLISLGHWLRLPLVPVPGAVLSLLGLGRGLTPSGDDVLAGALLGLHAAGRRMHAAVLGEAVTEAAWSKTNAISAAHLAAAADGGAAQPLQRFAAEILRGGGRLGELTDGVSRLGHSSGWDAVLGQAVALDAVLAGEGGGGLLPFPGQRRQG